MIKNIIYSPLASMFLSVVSGAFFLTFVSVWSKSTNLSGLLLGLFHSAYYGGIFIGAIKSEAIINRVGHIRAFASFSALLAFTMICPAFFLQNSLCWIVLRFAAGFSTAATYVIVESWLLAQSTKDNKGKILSIYMICLYSAQTLGQFGLDLVDTNTMQPFLLAGLIASISVIPASLTYVRAPEIKPLPRMSIVKYFKTSPLGIIGCMVSGLILSGIYSFFPVYALYHQISVSILLGITIAGGFMLQLPIGKLSDRFDRSMIITLLSLFIIILCCIISIFTLNSILIYTIAFFIGGLSFTLYPVCIALVCDRVLNSNIINVTSVLLCLYSIGATLGPTVISYLVEIVPSIAVFLYIIIVTSVLFCFGVYSLKTTKPVSQEEQVDFIAIPRGSPIASGLDPRVDEPN